MAKQLRDLLQDNSYQKKVITDPAKTLSKTPKRKEIEDALTFNGDPLPALDAEFELNDKKGNIFAISYRADVDSYYYIVKELV